MATASRFLRSAATVAVAAGSTAVAAPILLDSAGAGAGQFRPGRDASGDKLPIYPQPEPIVTLIETTHPISPYITQAREATQSAFSGAGEYVEGGVSRWIGFERKVEREVKSVLPADEPLTPGIIYVLISGLTGSVLTRTRSFPIRWLAPPLFAIASAPYFLPRTSSNVRAYLSRVEDAHFPDIARQHDELNSTVEKALAGVKGNLGNVSEQAKGLGQRAVKGMEDVTGLKVGEVRGEVGRRVEDAKVKAAERRQQQEVEKVGEVRTVGYVVEQKPVAEVVVPVAEKKDGKPQSRMV